MRNGQSPISKSATGNAFTPDIAKVLDNLKTGDQIYIENVKGKLANNQGTPRNLAPVAIKVQ